MYFVCVDTHKLLSFLAGPAGKTNVALNVEAVVVDFNLAWCRRRRAETKISASIAQRLCQRQDKGKNDISLSFAAVAFTQESGKMQFRNDGKMLRVGAVQSLGPGVDSLGFVWIIHRVHDSEL